MINKSTVPFWCVDEFLYWIMSGRPRYIWSSELLSRVSTFIDSYVLFEKLVLPERYKEENVIKKLDPKGEIFEFIKSDSLINSDDLSKGITIDLSLNMIDLDQLKKDDYKWFSQHDGYIEQKEFDWIMKEPDSISFAHLRLWQLSLVNEISELTRSTTILPISLQNINNLPYNETPIHMHRISEIGTHLHKIIKTVSTVEGDSFKGTIENCPPLFSLLVDKSHSNEHVIEVLFQIRKDFSELRFKANEFENLIKATNSLRDKNDIINEWNNSWGLILKGDFRKPQLIKKLVSSENIAKIIATPCTAGITSLLKALLDHINERRAYNRFSVYGEFYNELEGIMGVKKKLSDKFSVDLVNIIKN